MTLVWIASWEMQCCGDPFSPGDTVTWNVQPSQWVASWRHIAAQLPPIDWDYSEHDDSDSPPHELTGKVREVKGIWIERANGIMVLSPNPAITTADLTCGTGWDQDDQGNLVDGYLVTLDT